MEGDIAPFVKVDYLDRDAQEHSGLMLLDSGSNQNILTADMMSCVGDLSKRESEKGNIYTFDGVMVSVDYVNFSFAFGGSQFSEVFGISNINLPKVIGELQIIGILGIAFMQQHNLVIDYDNFTIHTSDVNADNLRINDCDFFVPMSLGLKYYNMPLLFMYQNGKEIIALADTGASNNIVASQTITNNGFECQYLDDMDTIIGLAGSVDMKEAMVGFNLLTLKEDDVEVLSHNELFKMAPHYVYVPKEGECDENGKQLPPIEAIISAPFMAKEGWLLDFGSRIIYKKHQANVLS